MGNELKMNWFPILHWPKYEVGHKFYNGRSEKPVGRVGRFTNSKSGRSMVIRKVELSPNGDSYNYTYGDGITDNWACGESFLENECHLQNGLVWNIEWSWDHLWLGLYSEGGKTYPYRKDYWLAIPFIAIHIVNTGESK